MPAVPSSVPAAPSGRFSEAPTLAEKVAAGELPPVEERLPENPSIYPCYEMIGKYGGTMRRGFDGVTDRTGPVKVLNVSLIHFNTDLSYRADVCESWEKSDDATAYTIHLRRGMKWSDGAPFDASAFSFYWQYEAMDPNVNSVVPERIRTGEPPVAATLEVVDDYTIIVRFAHPNPLFMDRLSRSEIFTPGHYMKQFHMDLTDDKAALEAQVKAAGLNSWGEYYLDRNNWWANTERPSIAAWLAQNDLTSELFVADRNPYFFATDPEGQQLPYIDRVTHRLFDKSEVFHLWILNGEIDFQHRHVELANYGLLKDGEAKGGYRVTKLYGGDGATMYVNQNCRDERIAEFAQNRNCRIAMNLAMNREEVNELVYDGLATIRQASPIQQSPHYHEAASKAYIEYDPDEANRLLDEAGYTERNAEGYRLWKDGSGPVGFILEGWEPAGSQIDDGAQMVVQYLAEVGIKATYKSQERFLVYERADSNNIEAVYRSSGHEVFMFLREVPYIGNATHHPWAGGWGIWYNNHDDPNGSPPPEGHFLWDIWALWEQANIVADDDVRQDLVDQIFDIWVQEAPVVGLLGQLPSLCVVKDGMRNFVEGFAQTDPTADEHLIGTPTLFWEEPELHA